MNRKLKRSNLKKLNQKMSLNNLPELTMEDARTMENFHRAYQMELRRVRKKRILVIWLLVIVGIAISFGTLFGYMDWILETLMTD